MKKRIVLLLVLTISFGLSMQTNVFGYSPHYLPGGKNYLSVDNFSYSSENHYSTIEPFLVKPYQEYTLTVSRDYYDEHFSCVEVEFYKDNSCVSSIDLELENFSYNVGASFESYSISFTTASNSNYMTVMFDDPTTYFSGGSSFNVQLEEGGVFSEYETYIEGALIDTSSPYFQNAGTVISYYDSPITVLEIQSALTAFDSIDGDVSNSISLISDTYSEHIDTLGSYECVFSVSDSSNNSAQVTVSVELIDVLSPVFTEINTIQAVYPNTYTTEDIHNMLSASDNYDGDISNEIVLISDGYTANANITGVYSMEFEVTDSSGNSKSYIQEIEVTDNEGPIISGLTEVIIGYDVLLTESDITTNLSFQDNYDESGTLVMIQESDNYTSNSETIGNYEMVFSVIDSSGNKTYQTVSIEVVDEIGPVVYFNSSVIQTYTDTVMELPDFTQLLINSSEIDAGFDYSVTVRYDSYTKNASTPGTYHLKLDLEDEFGKIYNKNLEVRVVNRPSDFIYQENVENELEISLFDTYKEYIFGGLLSVSLVASNVVWIVVFKKKH